MKKFMKKLVCAVMAVVLLITIAPVAKANAASEEFTLNATKKYLYVNAEARYPEAKYNKSKFDFDFKKHPENYLDGTYKYEWYSKNPKIAKVEKGGIVTAVAPGTTKI